MTLEGKKVAFLVAEGVEDLEYYAVAMRLQEEGMIVLTAAMDLNPIKGKNGLLIKPDTKIGDLVADDLFGLVLPGGWAPDKVRRYKQATDLVANINEQGKIIGIICHGGLLAISAKIVAGKKTIGSLGIKDDLLNAGAIWVDEPAFRDGNQVWGRIVADIPAFNRELVAAFREAAA
jgi:protease I